MRIAAIPYLDMDVYEGMLLILNTNPNAMLLLPITEHKQFTETVHKALKEAKNSYAVFCKEVTDDIKDITQDAADVYVTETPVDDILESITHGDILAVIDDGSESFTKTLDTIEGYGLTTVNMTDGSKIMAELHGEDDPLADVMDALEVFLETMVNYVAKEALTNMRLSLLDAMGRINEMMKDQESDDDEWEND